MKRLLYLLLLQITAGGDGDNPLHSVSSESGSSRVMSSKSEYPKSTEGELVDAGYHMSGHAPVFTQPQRAPSEGVLVDKQSVRSISTHQKSHSTVCEEVIVEQSQTSATEKLAESIVSLAKAIESNKPSSEQAQNNAGHNSNQTVPPIQDWQESLPNPNINDRASCDISNCAMTPRIETNAKGALGEMCSLLLQLSREAYVSEINDSKFKVFSADKISLFLRYESLFEDLINSKKSLCNKEWIKAYQNDETKKRYAITHDALENERNLVDQYEKFAWDALMHYKMLEFFPIKNKEIVSEEEKARTVHDLRRESAFDRLSKLSDSLQKVSKEIYQIQQNEPINRQDISSEEMSEWHKILFSQELGQRSIIEAEEKATMWNNVSDHPDIYVKKLITEREEKEGRAVLSTLMAKELPIALTKSNSTMFTMLLEFKQIIEKQQQEIHANHALLLDHKQVIESQQEEIENLKLQLEPKLPSIFGNESEVDSDSSAAVSLSPSVLRKVESLREGLRNFNMNEVDSESDSLVISRSVSEITGREILSYQRREMRSEILRERKKEMRREKDMNEVDSESQKKIRIGI